MSPPRRRTATESVAVARGRRWNPGRSILLCSSCDRSFHDIAERTKEDLAEKGATKELATEVGVQAARERVSAELEFIGDVEGIYLATRDGSHAE